MNLPAAGPGVILGKKFQLAEKGTKWKKIWSNIS
jgi:hypothetical protein